MEALSVSDYRNNLAAYFDQADKGQPVLIRRRNQLYTLTSIGKEDVMLTPKLSKRIKKNTLTERICKGLDEVKDIMDGKSKGYTVEELLNEL